MKLEAKMAIACRDEVEIDVALQVIEKTGICWYGGDKATDISCLNDVSKCRLYIYPPNRHHEHAYLLYGSDPDDFEDDDEDGFEWTYLEASQIFHNQIVSERRKRNAST